MCSCHPSSPRTERHKERPAIMRSRPLDPSLHELLEERPPLNQQNLAPAPAAQPMAWTHPASLPTFRPIGVRRAEPGTDFAEIDSSYCPYPAPAPAVPAPAPAILPPSAPATAPPPPTPPAPANAQSFIPVAASPIRGSNEPTLRPIVPGTGPGGLFNGGGGDAMFDVIRAAQQKKREQDQMAIAEADEAREDSRFNSAAGSCQVSMGSSPQVGQKLRVVTAKVGGGQPRIVTPKVGGGQRCLVTAAIRGARG